MITTSNSSRSRSSFAVGSIDMLEQQHTPMTETSREYCGLAKLLLMMINPGFSQTIGEILYLLSFLRRHGRHAATLFTTIECASLYV
jgi:hypothetical protein